MESRGMIRGLDGPLAQYQSGIAGRDLERVSSVAKLNAVVHVQFVIERAPTVYDEILRARDLPVEVADQRDTVEVNVLIVSVADPVLLRRTQLEGLRSGTVHRVIAGSDKKRDPNVTAGFVHK